MPSNSKTYEACCATTAASCRPTARPAWLRQKVRRAIEPLQGVLADGLLEAERVRLERAGEDVLFDGEAELIVVHHRAGGGAQPVFIRAVFCNSDSRQNPAIAQNRTTVELEVEPLRPSSSALR